MEDKRAVEFYTTKSLYLMITHAGIVSNSRIHYVDPVKSPVRASLLQLLWKFFFSFLRISLRFPHEAYANMVIWLKQKVNRFQHPETTRYYNGKNGMSILIGVVGYHGHGKKSP